MIEIAEEQNTLPKAFLVGEPKNNLLELKGLVDTLGMETVGTITLTHLEIQPAYGMGSGKAKEICESAKEQEADCIIFDFNLDPRKQRNWEKLSNIPCFDRQEVIIRIFAQRAKTKEAVLQVELARLSYSLPRLAHSYGDMARQRGGSYGSKGSGETQLELDQRQIRNRIAILKKELSEVEKTRENQRKRRTEKPVPNCALIGYTNAGKSSLLNALTGSDSLVEDKLFATLDPLTRRIQLKDGSGFLLTDTVGFISNLPHSLIDAFKSTLQEASDADLQLVVLDASDSNALNHYKTVLSVLEEIKKNEQDSKTDQTKKEEQDKIIVLNKWDKLNSESEVEKANILKEFPEAICVSAATKEGFENLLEAISTKLFGTFLEYHIPFEKQALLQEMHNSGIVKEELWQEEYIQVKAKLSHRTKSITEQYKA